MEKRVKICAPGNVCATVYGDTAKTVNNIAIGTAIVIAIILILKAIR